MDEDVTGSGGRLGKRPSESGIEVDYKTKVGTAWSHSYLNQKPWHPLSYPNQRRKWIAEQTHSNHAHRAEEVAREVAPIFCPSPDLCLQSFECFMTPRLARIDDPFLGVFPCSLLRSKSSFGRRLSSPRKRRRRLETGVPVRIKPFGVEIRNVRCVRPDDPNQQIVAEDIFDEYGGKSKKYSKRKSKHNPRSSRSHNEHEKHRDGDQSSSSLDSYESESDKESRQRSKSKYKKKHQTHTSISTDSEVKVDKERKDSESKHKKRRHRESSSSADTETDRRRRKSAR
ncbi:hypothetical protein B296_00027078, partial [Ensete ventricosum]